ncbi:hypothetical protein [Mycolicibacterium llatzerense]|uniref:hypothetical protein n=1 Tax=Mycolicibacterium llatzerense TaxID=280871 RepID=UPI0021B62066|nr:hypothetical protein [Mycolicibacterium llatzerense]
MSANERTVTGSKVGAEPTDADIVVAERIGPERDCTLIARSDGVAIWHTDKSAVRDVPLWLPPFGWEAPIGLYRGVDADALGHVLEHGLDVPSGCAFFATGHADKAWEYPATRSIAAMLVLDGTKAEPSYVCRPSGADDAWRPDKTLYPNAYVDNGRIVHTRFDADRGTRCWQDEQMYGHWIPGAARDALIAIVLGGPRTAIQTRLEGLQRRGSYRVEVLPG